MNVCEMHQQNRQAWNEGAARYEEKVERDIAFLRMGGRNFVAPEFRYLDNLGTWCRRAIHLQFEEHPDPYWEQFPNMSDEVARRVPQTFSLLMRKE